MSMRPKFKIILEMAIEEGVRRGYYQSYKHDNNPSEDSVISCIEDAVMSSLYEYFDFPDTNDESN
jgi:hypothetical protein